MWRNGYQGVVTQMREGAQTFPGKGWITNVSARCYMKKNCVWFGVVILALLLGGRLNSAVDVQAQTGSSRCIANVPASWGTFKGVSQSYGIGFEDSSGTLRFVNQFPCGFDQAPIVSLEVRRQ